MPPPPVPVAALATVPAKSTASGRNLGHATARSPAEFEVEGRNAADRPSKLECEVIDSDDGRYVLALTCVRPGEHTLTVRLEREEVIGSPMSFVAEPAKVRKRVKGIKVLLLFLFKRERLPSSGAAVLTDAIACRIDPLTRSGEPVVGIRRKEPRRHSVRLRERHC